MYTLRNKGSSGGFHQHYPNPKGFSRCEWTNPNVFRTSVYTVIPSGFLIPNVLAVSIKNDGKLHNGYSILMYIYLYITGHDALLAGRLIPPHSREANG
jgi:hypothetical protein